MDKVCFYFLSFIIYSFLGYICEVIYVFIITKKITNRGFLYGPLVPIYGFGAMLILGVFYPLKSIMSWYQPIIVFIVGLLLTSLLEYLASLLIELIFHIRLWDYSKHKVNINGRVCLLNSSLFAILVLLVFYLIDPYVVSFLISSLLNLSEVLTYIVSGILFIIFSFDFAFSLKTHIKLSLVIKYMEKAYTSIQNGVDIIKEKTEDFKDSIHDKIMDLRIMFENSKTNRLIEKASLRYPSFKVILSKSKVSFIDFITDIKRRIKGE